MNKSLNLSQNDFLKIWGNFWKAAYINLAMSKGSNTPFLGKLTIDGITLDK